jgi:transcriptional regulator with XRE-family HTH domain
MSKTLGDRIRELREAKDLSLREFAGKLKLSPAFVSDVELGRRYPSDAVLAKMAKTLGAALEGLKSYDTRSSVSELKRRAYTDPDWGFAFRRVVESGLTPDELLRLANSKTRRPKESE